MSAGTSRMATRSAKLLGVGHVLRVVAAGAFVLGIIAVQVKMQSQYLMTLSRNAAISCGSSFAASISSSSTESRLLKYHQSYRYFPPADRYDYNPYPHPDCGQGADFDAFFNLDSKVRSANGEDKFIYETFFKSWYTDGGGGNLTGPHGGRYVEIGAYNGLQESNSHFFDKCLGWEGLLVEGNPISYQQVVSSREYAHKMSFAPSCSAEYEQSNRTIQFSRYPMTNAGLKGHAKTYDAKPMVDVPCGPFTPVLIDVFRGEPISFFSLDVEGAEKLVLDTINFDQVTVWIWMIEIQNDHCNKGDCAVRRLVREKMKSMGYKRYENLVRKSDIYVHSDSPYQIPGSMAQPID